MDTKNKRLLDREENRKYYSKSDGHFATFDQSLDAGKFLKRVEWVENNVKKLGSYGHLDIGCKDGYTCLTIARKLGVKCLGIDPSVDAIEEAKAKAKKAGVHKSKLDYKVDFIEDYIIEEEINGHDEWDTISLMEVIEHVTDVHAVMKKISNLGRFIMITTPNYYGMHGWQDAQEVNEEHVRIYKKVELEKLVSQYGNIMESVIVDHELFIMYKRF